MNKSDLWKGIAVFSVSAICLAFFARCAPSEPELPYEEKIVIRGLLEAGQLLSDVQISRTIPVLDEFTYEKIFVGNAVASITVDGQVYPMELQARTSTSSSVPYRSLYRVPGLRVSSGKTYSLEVRWHNLIAKAQTTVPLSPEVDSASVVASVVRIPNGMVVVSDTVFESSAQIRTRANEVYRVGTTLYDAQNGRFLSSRGFGDASYFSSAQVMSISSNVWRYTPSSQLIASRIQARVNIEAYDGDYYQYYQTRSRSGQIGLFSPGGPNIVWNVTGDGIGEFVGMALSQRPAFVRLK